MTERRTIWLMLAAFAAGAAVAHADNWPQFRGPNASGVSQEQDLPADWGTSKNIHWKVALPGVGWSSPIVWEDRVFVTTAVSEDQQEAPRKGLYFGGDRPLPRNSVYRWEVICLDRHDGRILWRKVAAEGKPTSSIHIKNSYASETPVTDGQRLYAFFGSAGIYCFDLDGELIWNKDLGSFQTRMGWGTASSPVLDADRLFLQCDKEEQSFLVALDKKTGEPLWRTERDEKSSWGTPFVWRSRERTELVTSATKRVRSYDPATGNLLWELAGMSVIVSPTPLGSQDLLYVSSGYVMDRNRPLFAIRPGSSGDISLRNDESSNRAIAWSQKAAGPYIPSPLLYEGLLYVLYDQGFFACFDAQSGEPVYGKQRLERGAGGFTASPWAYEGKIFCLNEDGDTFVIQAGREYLLIGKNSLDDFFMASPAIAQGALFLRSMNSLYCIRQESGAPELNHDQP
jgi:outer membrane protein assembly factor BamB